jgi:hypothetical protein
MRGRGGFGTTLGCRLLKVSEVEIVQARTVILPPRNHSAILHSTLSQVAVRIG